MSDNEAPVTEAVEPAAPEAAPTTGETAAPVEPTIDLAALETSLREDIRRAEQAARRAQGDSAARTAKLEKQISRLESVLEALATRGMDDNEKRAWVAERALERERETSQDPQLQYQQASAEFQLYASQKLAEEGIKPEEINEVFQRLAADAKSPADWKAALNAAIAERHKAEAKKAREEAAERERRAREDERAKIRNERRKEEAPVDKGQPASIGEKPVRDMTDEEFLAYDKRRTEAARRRRIEQIMK